ncbi:hypothetical protein A3H65_00445 [Candidatus Giovannonibacteria bacterium RIFCSPLOWO2_02_FULL_45_14]|uniref:Uncharacterized protein n=1 Tax=Candidatus Giovannonibacteria bacterium RIFCSPLOWO2_12_FULL_44_15 TaxID=1798364 RepID=A0A1F5XYX4_9BACT|nr:MAG: hypothetical protein A3C75_00015 [Candidatus Giovannonibacteria bacterium RIFCSPHIGHO2_02_FULL_44_31]OGF76758.1 MAG: hypothetical protein A3E62_04110 [Candidatus Giovannonibacteria bacterium RIFCSPHIGHO2_12_FULL_44_29]OGF91262.1 MAG: hypothetical protein A3H65_00445 [Candidatus Giovannonibacteria bacterium RIFCSPLOWO2_02_FULL_45_14]OGF93114.1 MAG: hypothetical protein A3G54_02530 [Candidatus Giovannonibacteria bacterium RIFCSPLOWO2_12_FULL_44_15]
MPKKNMTIDDLAAMTNRGLEGVKKEISGEMRENTDRILRAVDGLELKISAYASSWDRNFDKLHEWMKDHEERLTVLEKQKR